ncbi:MAG TPA: glycosyltransferase family 4 protein [Solirubrobacteraceae bacterium]|nr:glycosyltransferase family 4 protein [Solirubrobacteraceae bacterium]
MRVLYVNHTATVSGGERSLLELLRALPSEVEVRLACPPGSLQERAKALGVPCTSIAGTAGSLRLHPLHTPLALTQMSLAAAQVARAAERSPRADVVHANSIRAGIVLGLARRMPLPRLRLPRETPTLVHVRDVLPPSRASTASLRLIVDTATIVIANSEHTAASVRAAAPDARVKVLHNPVDLGRFDPEKIDRAEARAKLGEAGRRELLLGVVAQLTPWKGQDTAIEALGALRREGVDAQLLLIGAAKFTARATRFDNERYVASLHELAAREGVADRVSWLGEREDVPELMRALDVLLLPSWEEPFGRALIEAMALEVPVLATNVGGPVEIVREGVDGFLLPPREPTAWASAIAQLHGDRELAARLGRAGRERVLTQFTSERHARATLDVYEHVQILQKQAGLRTV